MRGSQQDLPVAIELPDGSAIRVAEWGGMAVELGSFTNGADPAPLYAGLPDDRCQCPLWGYVIKGQIQFNFADRTEIFAAGDVYHVGPGHLPVLIDGAEWVEFSPIAPYQSTMKVVGQNMESLGIG